jgi:hypothetical protein
MFALRSTRIISVLLALFFLTSILTVEYHQGSSGSLRSRCPTCIEGNTELAVNGFPMSFLKFYNTSEPFFSFGEEIDTGALVVFSDICRGPPSPVLF